MTMHASEGQIQALLDEEMETGERNTLLQHIAGCSDCQNRKAALSARRERVHGVLGAFDYDASLTPLPRAALARFRGKNDLDQKEPIMKRIFTRQSRWAWTLAALVLLVCLFSLEPVRVWAGGLLGIFRIQQIAVLPIDTNNLNGVSSNSALAQEMSRIFSDSTKVTKEPGKPQTVASTAEASQKAGFKVRALAGQTAAPRISVQGASAFEFTVNRARAQQVLTELGSKYQLPAALDGARISVSIPAGVAVEYNCPTGDPQTIRRPADLRNCVSLLQIPSPTVTTPPEVDVQTLAVAGLEMTGMSAAEAQNFTKTIDWTSTLVIPVPRSTATYQEIQVDGVKGYVLNTTPNESGPRYAIVWVKDGIVYSVSGLGDQAKGLGVAASLKLE